MTGWVAPVSLGAFLLLAALGFHRIWASADDEDAGLRRLGLGIGLVIAVAGIAFVLLGAFNGLGG